MKTLFSLYAAVCFSFSSEACIPKWEQYGYQLLNQLPPATQLPPDDDLWRNSNTPPLDLHPNLPKNGDNCGHSKYWSSGEVTLELTGGNAIVGGVSAQMNEVHYPYQARITWKGSNRICGATVISRKFVLTAAHCCDEIDFVEDLKVIVGDHDRLTVDGEVSLQVSQVIVHPNYNVVNNDFDFCLIRVAESMVWTRRIQPVCLPSSCSQQCSDSNIDGTTDHLIVTGWGALSEVDANVGVAPQILQKTRLPYVSTAACENIYKRAGTNITDNMLCAGYETGGIDTCQGDSGGPLVCYKHGFYQLDGITSFGNGCARKNFYGVYARVCKALDWISTTMDSPLPTRLVSWHLQTGIKDSLSGTQVATRIMMNVKNQNAKRTKLSD